MKSLLMKSLKLQEKNKSIIEKIDREYDKIIEDCIKYHETLSPLPQKKKEKTKLSQGHNLLIRFKEFKSCTLIFLKEDCIPFRNNLAKRDFRMMKLKQKILGCFRTEKDFQYFAIIRSFISTLKKQNKNIFIGLRTWFSGKI